MILTNWYWYSLKDAYNKQTKVLSGDKNIECVVVGGGIAGLTTAYFLSKQNYKVILIEKEFCGAGASGKSSGFISPDSEQQLTNFITKTNLKEALKLWDFSWSGVNIIKDIINSYNFNCDYMAQDAALLANNYLGSKDIKIEYENRVSNGYNAYLYEKEINKFIGSNKYYGGLIQPNCFSINSFLYCQELKNILIDQGVEIYEKSPLINIDEKNNYIITPNGKINYEKAILCLDKFLPEFNIESNNIYNTLTFLMLSKSLTDKEIHKIFPKDPLMVSDTQLTFNYYRLTPDNRLLLGGSPFSATYSNCNYNEICMNKYINQAKSKSITYFNNYFPEVSIDFEYIWPGLIGITKDLIPIVGQKNNLYYISGATGLSWASGLAKYICDKISNNRNDLDSYFNPNRGYIIPDFLQNLLGNKITFALSNFISSRY